MLLLKSSNYPVKMTQHLPKLSAIVSEEAVSGRQKPSNVSLGFVLYQNDRFFRSRRYQRRRATIRVLSGSVKGQERSVVPQHVEMLFRPTVRKHLVNNF